MIDWLLHDGLTLALFGVATYILWHSITTSFGTAIILGVLLILPLKGPVIELWNGIPVFAGQPSLVFSCVALAIVHHRLGPLAAHRVWRMVSIALILVALILTRINSNGELYNDSAHVRLWASLLLQFVFVGGLGQVLWRQIHIEGVQRYALTWLSFPVSSMIYSMATYYTEAHSFWLLALWSGICAVYFGTIFLGAFLLAVRYCPDDPTGPGRRLRQSIRELEYDRQNHHSIQGQRRKHKRHGP